MCFNNVAISLYNVDRFGNRRRKKRSKTEEKQMLGKAMAEIERQSKL